MLLFIVPVIICVFLWIGSEDFLFGIAGGLMSFFFMILIIACINNSVSIDKFNESEEIRYELTGVSIGVDKEGRGSTSCILVTKEDGTCEQLKIKNVKLFNSQEAYVIEKTYEPKGLWWLVCIGRTEYEVYADIENHTIK